MSYEMLVRQNEQFEVKTSPLALGTYLAVFFTFTTFNY